MAERNQAEDHGTSLDAPVEDKEDAAENHGLSAVSVYIVVHEEGMDELRRPVKSLWWSGVAAGIAISASVLAEGILHSIFEDHPYRPAIENLGYTVGFVLVILGRLQLFTENTITAILPLLSRPSRDMLWCTARLWTIVFFANMVGTLSAAIMTLWIGTVPPDYVEGMMAISAHYAELGVWDVFVRGTPAGFFVAAIVWMLPSARASSIFVIMMFTYLIAMGDFTHVIAGSTELFLLLLDGQIGVSHALSLLVATLLGNILGGTGLFAVLAYGQVADEMDDEAQRADRR
ncbi:formate/nitrite transporter family protein [Paracoccus aurantiacus]|uniref:Formate/nitrite transporter family protein n=1 Tax=Paracoccus aurantiacus TaxID=2599412 RepID=A0A5C6S3N5_9RHOB|nr:formate/nitrite transporter family protein [Paracoccus aurantiacus]TXB68580.1 formate/nitrite transporter family protein [Paracoccus aurantiacus]